MKKLMGSIVAMVTGVLLLGAHQLGLARAGRRRHLRLLQLLAVERVRLLQPLVALQRFELHALRRRQVAAAHRLDRLLQLEGERLGLLLPQELRLRRRVVGERRPCQGEEECGEEQAHAVMISVPS